MKKAKGSEQTTASAPPHGWQPMWSLPKLEMDGQEMTPIIVGYTFELFSGISIRVSMMDCGMWLYSIRPLAREYGTAKTAETAMSESIQRCCRILKASLIHAEAAAKSA